MPLQENKALVRRFVEKVQNQHNLAEIDELCSPNFVDHSGAANLPGIEGVKAFFTMMFTAFPDMHFTIRQQLAEGDQVATQKTFFGTHLGTFMAIPPTGKQVSVEVIDIYTISEGKITDHWSVGDFLSMMQQLGVVPAPE
ncbi:MAG: ester cyclase [Anaerolineales bacterium]|nr:ester cyclase [Anaerolineales bacterium]